MGITLIVDTNKVRNEKSFDQLLGSREDLLRLSGRVKLVLPEIVLEEIVQQKRRYFDSELIKLRGNGVARLAGLSEAAIDKISFAPVEGKVRSDNSVPYYVEPFEFDAVALERIKAMALGHRPPFEANSDKGFKDACIALTAESYANKHSDERVYLITEDKLLAEYFDGSSHVTCIRDFKDIDEVLGDRPSTKVLPEQGEAVAVSENQVHELELKDAAPSNPIRGQVRSLIAMLRGSKSFARTHQIVSQLVPLSSAMTPDEDVELISAAVDNDQVNWILKDPDVEGLLLPVFYRCEDALDDSTYNAFVFYAELKNERAAFREDLEFTNNEIQVYRAFADALSESIVNIGSLAVIEPNDEKLLNKLVAIRKVSLLEKDISANVVVECFVHGVYTCLPEGRFPVEVLSDFVDMAADAYEEKRGVLFAGLRNRLAEAPKNHEDIPF